MSLVSSVPTGDARAGSGDAARTEARHGTTPVPDYRMSMPVELWFGEHHIGVKAGTTTCADFLRYANDMLSDFRAATTARE